jgi:hypothetical protein
MDVPNELQEKALDDFLEGQPRSSQWREMRLSLQDRLRDAITARDAAIERGEPQPALERKVRDLREKVSALAQEEAITRFVEDSVRSSLMRPLPAGFGGEDDAGYDGPPY